MKATCPACQHVQILVGSNHTADEHRFVCSKCGKMGSFKPRRGGNAALMQTVLLEKSPPRPSIPLPHSQSAKSVLPEQTVSVDRATHRPASASVRASSRSQVTRPDARRIDSPPHRATPAPAASLSVRPKQPTSTHVPTLPPERRRAHFSSTRPGVTTSRRATEETLPNGKPFRTPGDPLKDEGARQGDQRTTSAQAGKLAPVKVVIKGYADARPSTSRRGPMSLPPPRKSLPPPLKPPTNSLAPERSTRRQDTTSKQASRISSPDIGANATLESSGYKVDTGSWLISTDGQDRRCLSLAQVLEGWSAGQLAPDTQVWRSREQVWVPILQIPELGDMLVSDDDPTLVAASAFAQIAKRYHKAATAPERAPSLPSPASHSIRPEDYSFSLAALGGSSAQAATARVSDPSGLLIHPSVARMGGTADALLFQPPVTTMPELVLDAERPRGKRLMRRTLQVISGLATVALVAFSTSTLLSRSNKSPAPVTPFSASSTLAEVPPLPQSVTGEAAANPTTPTPQETAPAAAVEVDPVLPEAQAVQPAEANPAVHDEQAPAPVTTAARASTQPTSPAPSVGRQSPKSVVRQAAPKTATTVKEPDVAFNKSAAITAMGQAALQAASCARPEGPRGSGKIQVSFANSGRATSAVIVEGLFVGTPVGSCVARYFRSAKVPAFSGDQATVLKAFRVP